MTNWKFYSYAMIPDIEPHEIADTDIIKNGLIWKDNKNALLARWTTDFDCGFETNWWYCIKDTPFDIMQLKSKKRYEINRGNRFFYIKKIDPNEYENELYSVACAAFSVYPAKYRPDINEESFHRDIESWTDSNVYAAFHRETDELCGYAVTDYYEEYIKFSILKSNPQYERYQVNAALVGGMLDDNNKLIENGIYVCDGSRNINHETAFQDYLEKYFGFRKAYCKLHIAYNPKIKWAIGFLYHMRKLFAKFDNIGYVHNLNGVLKMEEIVREDK